MLAGLGNALLSEGIKVHINDAQDVYFIFSISFFY